MLPSPHRLRLRRDFGVATRRGRRAGSSTVVVHLAQAHDTSTASDAESPGAPARLGFVVSRACGPAVTRNRVRRRLRHLMLCRLTDLPDGGLLVVRALPAAAAANTTRLDADLACCLDRLAAATDAAGS